MIQLIGGKEHEGHFTKTLYQWYTTAEVGAMVLENWRLPQEIVLVTKKNHDNNLTPDNVLICAVNVANILVKGLDIGNSDGNYITPLSNNALLVLGLDFDDLQFLLKDIESQMKASNFCCTAAGSITALYFLITLRCSSFFTRSSVADGAKLSSSRMIQYPFLRA